MLNFVFDLYGTLVDISTDEYSREFWQRFTAYAAETFGAGEGLEREYSKILGAYTGYSEPDICAVIRLAIQKSGGVVTVGQSRRAAEMFRTLSTRRLSLCVGAAELLKALLSRGAKPYILSNAQAAFTMPELKKLNLIQYFYGIELSSRFGQKKPSPAFFKHIISKYSLNVSQTIYIGNDILCDILPARALGLKTAYILSPASPPSDSLKLATSAADFSTDSFGSLSEYLISQLP